MPGQVNQQSTTPADGSITLAKLADLATDKVIGRVTASTGVPEAVAFEDPIQSLADDLTMAALRTTAGLGTGNSPEFTAVNVGHASDSTLARASAGNLTVAGNALYRAGGTDVAIADGGTGAGDAATARSNLAVGGLVLGGSASSGTEILKATVNLTAVGNVGAGTDDLITYALPASVLNAAGRVVRVTVWGTTANNSNAKTVTMNFGAVVVVSYTLTVSIAGRWRGVMEIHRTGTSTQDCVATMSGNVTSSSGNTFTGFATGTETETNALTIKCTGTATTNDDIVQEGLMVEVLN